MQKLKKRLHWTPAMDAHLRQHYPTCGAVAAMLEFGLTRNQVSNRARVLGIKCEHGTSPVVSVELRELRQKARAAAGESMLDKRKWFTPEMDALMREHYATKGAQYIADVTGMCKPSIYHRARLLGLHFIRKTGRKRGSSGIKHLHWTPEMDARLTELYPVHGAAITAAMMGLRFFQVKGRVGSLGLKGTPGRKTPRPPKPAPVQVVPPLLEVAVKVQAAKPKLSAVEIARLPGTKQCKPAAPKVKPVKATEIDMSRARVTVVPPKVDPRFYVDPSHVGEFSRLPIGQYINELVPA